MKCVKEFHFTKYLKEIMCKHHLNHNKNESLMHLIDFFSFILSGSINNTESRTVCLYDRGEMEMERMEILI